MARAWLSTGVITGRLNQLAVSADGSAMSVSVATGQAQVEGFFYENDSALALTIATAHATLGRIDTVVVRLDRTANSATLVVVTGTAAASPVAPPLSATDSLYELPLANVQVDPAVGVITAGKVTDRRVLVKNLTEAAASAAYGTKAARVYSTVTQSIANNTTTVLTFDAERYDTDAFHDTAVNNTRLTVPAGLGGKYRITLLVSFAPHATGYRGASFRVNGSTFIADGKSAALSGVGTPVVLTAEWDMAAGDYVEATVRQTSGGALSTEALSAYTPEFSISRIGA